MIFTSLEVCGLHRFLRFSGNNLIMPFYAVLRGRVPGIYDSWDKCRENTDGYPKAIFKSFKSKDEAVAFCVSNGLQEGHNLNSVDRAHSPESIEIMESDDDNQSNTFSQLPMTTDSMKPAIEHNSFNFESFSQRLTHLENTYKKKVKELEERIEALEASRILNMASDNDFTADFSLATDPKSSRSLSAVKRTSSKADLQDNISVKKSKTSQKIKITSHDGVTYDFEADEEGYVKAYTDGACSKNGRYGAKAGVGVWFGENHPLNISEPVQGRATNNMAEIQAGTWAIQQGIRVGVKKICVLTDSQFLISCITQWIKKWKRNGWKTATGDVINKDELEVLDKVIQYPGLNVKWEYVKGHCGNKGNERADFLARQGVARYKSSNIDTLHPWQRYFET